MQSNNTPPATTASTTGGAATAPPQRRVVARTGLANRMSNKQPTAAAAAVPTSASQPAEGDSSSSNLRRRRTTVHSGKEIEDNIQKSNQMSQTVRDSIHQKLLEELKQQDRVIMEVEDEEFKLDSPPNELQGSAANRGNNRQTTRHPVDIDEMMKQESLDSDLFNEIARLEDKEEEKGIDEGLMHLTME